MCHEIYDFMADFMVYVEKCSWILHRTAYFPALIRSLQRNDGKSEKRDVAHLRHCRTEPLRSYQDIRKDGYIHSFYLEAFYAQM